MGILTLFFGFMAACGAAAGGIVAGWFFSNKGKVRRNGLFYEIEDRYR